MKFPFITYLFIVTSVLFVLSLIGILFFVPNKFVLISVALGIVAASLNIWMVFRGWKRSPQASPLAALSLGERAQNLGLEFRQLPGLINIPYGIRGYFIQASDGLPTCQYCQSNVDEVVCANPAVNPSSLGVFCTDCGSGRLYDEVNVVRKHVSLPALPNGNLFVILNVLERDALEKGIIHAPDVEVPKLPETTTFRAVIQHTGDFRNAPLKVRVDVDTQSVTVIEGEQAKQTDSPLRRIK